MQHPVCGLLRIHLPRTRVNKAPGRPWLTALDPPQLARRLGAATATERSERVENRPSNVASEGDLGWSEQADGDKFGYRRKQLGSSAGGEKLGCSLYEVPPGRRAWPYHYHLANEEAIYVLEGSGTLRLGEREVALSRGDYVALLVGETGAHQVINTTEAPLRYLCFSTNDRT